MLWSSLSVPLQVRGSEDVDRESVVCFMTSCFELTWDHVLAECNLAPESVVDFQITPSGDAGESPSSVPTLTIALSFSESSNAAEINRVERFLRNMVLSVVPLSDSHRSSTCSSLLRKLQRSLSPNCHCDVGRGQNCVFIWHLAVASQMRAVSKFERLLAAASLEAAPDDGIAESMRRLSFLVPHTLALVPAEAGPNVPSRETVLESGFLSGAGPLPANHPARLEYKAAGIILLVGPGRALLRSESRFHDRSRRRFEGRFCVFPLGKRESSDWGAEFTALREFDEEVRGMSRRLQEASLQSLFDKLCCDSVGWCWNAASRMLIFCVVGEANSTLAGDVDVAVSERGSSSRSSFHDFSLCWAPVADIYSAIANKETDVRAACCRLYRTCHAAFIGLQALIRSALPMVSDVSK